MDENIEDSYIFIDSITENAICFNKKFFFILVTKFFSSWIE